MLVFSGDTIVEGFKLSIPDRWTLPFSVFIAFNLAVLLSGLHRRYHNEVVTESSLVCTMHVPSTDPGRCVVINLDGCSDASIPNTMTFYTYRKPSPFAVVVFLKNSADGKTVRKKWG